MPALARQHGFPPLLHLIAQHAERDRKAVLEASDMTIFGVNVRGNLLRPEDQLRLKFEKLVLLLLQLHESRLERPHCFPVRRGIPIHVVDQGRVERLLPFEDGRYHRPRVCADTTEPPAALSRLLRHQLPPLIQRGKL
jgi:hypothetical protein